VSYFVRHGWHGLPILGVVVLCLTGGEALYADMGHFGARPIRLAWVTLAMPSLVLCYFGQGALMLTDPSTLANPFFALVPTGLATYALVALATAATVIASQALISGVFSLTNQAMTLGFFPRVTIEHTSHETEGQIYVPEMNWALMLGATLLVLFFKESSRLAAAFGIAVSGTMAITSVTFYLVTRQTWRWPVWKALPVLVLFLSFDVPFFVANLFKFMDGGYVPIFLGCVLFVVMVIWKSGRLILSERLNASCTPLDQFLATLDERIATRVPGTSIFMASASKLAPAMLEHHARRIHVLSENVVLLTVVFEHAPFVGEGARLEVERLDRGFVRVTARYGFMQHPNIPELLAQAKVAHDLARLDLAGATYFLGRETFLATARGKMGPLSEGIFAFLSRNARSATAYFAIPPEQVVEIGTQIDL
jgi:KUP system potassium uptake protein